MSSLQSRIRSAGRGPKNAHSPLHRSIPSELFRISNHVGGILQWISYPMVPVTVQFCWRQGRSYEARNLESPPEGVHRIDQDCTARITTIWSCTKARVHAIGP